MEEKNKNSSLIKRENISLVRVNKTLEITNKLLVPVNKPEPISYKSVKIGTQEWMVENLNVYHFRNGEIIPEAKTTKEWKDAGENGKPAWCYYRNNPENGNEFGRLYNWYAVNDNRTIAPIGWHIASESEWTILIDYLGGTTNSNVALRESGTTHWFEPISDADNSSGFTALPGGYRFCSCEFDNIGWSGCWWTSTESNITQAYCWNLARFYSFIWSGNDDKASGFSVRCIRDY